MSQNSGTSLLVDKALYGKWLTQRYSIWQMGFLDADELAQFSRVHGVSSFKRKDIMQLWQLGLLPADKIISQHRMQHSHLIEQNKDDDGYIYSDERPIPVYTENWEQVQKSVEPLSPDVHIFFHPFRFYVLVEMEALLLRYQVSTKQHFPVESFAVPDFASFRRYANSDEFKAAVQQWNTIASLAIIAEPCFYQTIFHSLKVDLSLKGDMSFEELRQRIFLHWETIKPLYQSLSIEQYQALHQELCCAAQTLDANSEVHTIVRLGSAEMRLKLEGHLGGATFLFTIAEIIRRATERALNKALREEDECGFGWSPEGAKELLYGSNRLLDGDRMIASEFLRQHGLVYGPRISWYVEGDTEWGALSDFFKQSGATDIEVINLGANVAQHRGRGVAFRDSLRSDIEMHIFSFVLIDGDRPDFTYAVRKAAQDDEIFGAFFFSIPDFEFANFEKAELEDILWAIAIADHENSAAESDRIKLHNAIKDTNNGTSLINCAKSSLPQLFRLCKDKDWGRRLIEYAWKHPYIQGKQRQVVEAIKYAFYLARTTNLESYEIARRMYQVDRATGRLVKRLLTVEQ